LRHQPSKIRIHKAIKTINLPEIVAINMHPIDDVKEIPNSIKIDPTYHMYKEL
jgi:hypothetical protein